MVVIGWCLFVIGAYFGSHFSGESTEASLIYRKALDDEWAIQIRMIETEDNLGDSSEVPQALVHEYNQLHEVAKSAVERRNRLGSMANRLFLLSLLGAFIVLVPVLFWLVRLPRKLFNDAL